MFLFFECFICGAGVKDEMFKSEVEELLNGSLEGVPERLARAARL